MTIHQSAEVILVLLFAPGVLGAESGAAAELLTRAAAARADPAHGKILYLKHCVPCHGPHGWGDGPRDIPAIAGQHESYILEQLASFATGERAGSATHGPAMHDTLQPADVDRPQALRDLASYLSRAGWNPRPDYGEPRRGDVGKRAYATECIRCHGADGAASDNQSIPRIAGQHYRYVLAQLQDFAVRHHLQVDTAVSEFAAKLSIADQDALADYISRLAPPSPSGTP